MMGSGDSRRPSTPTLLAVWSVAVAGGMLSMMAYDSAPEVTIGRISFWPENSRIVRAGKRPTLLVWLHPKCPCSAATVDVLIELLRHRHPPTDVVAMVVVPKGAPADWPQCRQAARLCRTPDVRLQVDWDGIEAGRFYAATSGFVQYFDEAGRLRFNGGVTPARNDHGDSASRLALLNFMQSTASSDVPAVDSAVFGCQLFGIAARAQRPAREVR